MKIIGIDPGPSVSGWCMIDELENVIEAGVVESKSMPEIIISKKPGIVGLEVITPRPIPTPKTGKPGMVGREVLMAQLIAGMALQASIHSGAAVITMSTQQLRRTIGAPGGTDADVGRALNRRYGHTGTAASQGPLKGVASHAKLALAAAICALSYSKFEKNIGVWVDLTEK